MDDFSFDLPVAAGGGNQVPEPATVLLLAAGLVGFVVRGRRLGRRGVSAAAPEA